MAAAGSPIKRNFFDSSNVAAESSEILINLCRKHNGRILSILHEQQQTTDVTELIRTTQRIHQILGRCVHDYGSLDNIQLQSVETVYLNLFEYEKKIQQLQGKGTLVRFITQSRLRGKIDQLSNSICIQVEGMEREIRNLLFKQYISDNSDEFSELLEQIDQEYANKLKANGFMRKSANELRKSIDSERMIQDKETREKLDSALSIIKDSKRREELIKSIPRFFVKPSISDEVICTIAPNGLNDEQEKIYGDYIFARSISTYPFNNISGTRDGDPICDMYCLQNFENRIIGALADGCGWGIGAKEAARKASQMFVSFMKRQQHTIKHTEDAANLILRAYWAAHKAIVEGKNSENVFESGTTTMIAGIMLELSKPENGKKYAFVFASVGDCKAFHWSPNGIVSEITRGNRAGHDMRDPGGRLGPHSADGGPDLRNFAIYSFLCNEGDIISLVSDGVHDNFDPKVMGKKPSDLHIHKPNDEWIDLTPQDEEILFKWTEDFINKLIPKPITGFIFYFKPF